MIACRRRSILHLLAGLAFCLTAAYPAAAGSPFQPSRSSPLFLDDFENLSHSKGVWGPAGSYRFSEGHPGTGMLVTQSDPGLSTLVQASVDLKGTGGLLLAFSAHCRAEKIQTDGDPATGASLTILIHSKNKPPIRHAVPAVEGTRGWRNAGVLLAVPAEAESATLCLGMEAATGWAFFDNVRLAIVRSPEDFPPPRDPSLPIDKGHALGMLRGAMIHPALGEGDLELLGGAWNANLIRWQLGSTQYSAGLATPGFDAVLEAELALLDRALPVCARLGVLVLVDLHSLSAGCFDSVQAQDQFVAVWEAIALRYRGEPVVWGYDLANEPDGTLGAWGDGVLLWDELAERTARAIRAVDAGRPIVVEPLHGSPSAFPLLKPLDFSIPGILYSVHMYEPVEFTHQTLLGSSTPYLYPGHVGGEFWDKERLRTALRPVLDFQEKYRVAVLVGEFSAIRWAPQGGAYRYIRDAIEVFEESGWDWVYHAFREWHGWSAEHTEDPKNAKPASEPTDRELLLRAWFAGNAKYFPSHDRPVTKP